MDLESDRKGAVTVPQTLEASSLFSGPSSSDCGEGLLLWSLRGSPITVGEQGDHWALDA